MRRTVRNVLVALGMLVLPPALSAQAIPVTEKTLLDRIQIEDLVTSYYYNLGKGDAQAFGDYYIDDAEFDVNGTVVKGRDGVADLYRRLAAGNGPGAHGTFHMLLSNPQIQITGEVATARFLWTGIANDEVHAPPRFVEQGREYDILVKRKGVWRIAKRVVIADSGLPPLFDRTYTPRKDYDVGRR